MLERILQHLVSHLIDKKPGDHESERAGARRKSISYQKNKAKVRKKRKQRSDGAPGVIRRGEGDKCKVEMSEPAKVLRQLKVFCRSSVASSSHTRTK